MSIACRLCGSTRNKRVKSHIAPAAFFREIKRRGGGLFAIPKNGLQKVRASKDGPKDHTILCFKCEAATAPIDDYGTSAFLTSKFKLHKIYTKSQRIAGYSDVLDGCKLKLFFIFTLLKASWSNSSLYAHFSLPEQINRQFLTYLNSGKVDNNFIYCMLIRRHPTVKDVPGSPEVHNGAVNCSRHAFNEVCGYLISLHILEYTALLFVRDAPSLEPPPSHFIQDSGRIWVYRSQAINERLDNIAFEFMRHRLNTEPSSSTV